MPKISINTKNKVKLLLRSINDRELLGLIRKIDFKYSLKINIADKLRIAKLLEVYFETKKNITYFNSKRKKINNYEYFKVLISPNKEKLKLNIEKRFFKMFDEGLVAELKKHKDKVINCNVENAIGFKEVSSLIENKISVEKVKALVIKKTKGFAKRQYTWFDNRFEQNLKVSGLDNLSLVVETFDKII